LLTFTNVFVFNFSKVLFEYFYIYTDIRPLSQPANSHTLMPTRILATLVRRQNIRLSEIHKCVLLRRIARTTYVNADYYYRLNSMDCRSAYLPVTVVSPAKMAEPIEMPFVGLWTRMVPRNKVLDRGLDPHAKGEFWGVKCVSL